MMRKDWLGGLDSNQDSQIQSLESYQLDDLPVVASKGNYIIAGGVSAGQMQASKEMLRRFAAISLSMQSSLRPPVFWSL